MLDTPGFHHLHLNSVDPEAAIAFYTGLFPSTRKAEWGGHPALYSPISPSIGLGRVASMGSPSIRIGERTVLTVPPAAAG